MKGRAAALLVAPAALLVLAAFIAPLLYLLTLAVRSPELAETLPETAVQVRLWSGDGLPPEAAFAAVARELAGAEADQTIGPLASRLNFEQQGLRALLLRTARARLGAPYASSLVAFDARWGEPGLWRTLRDVARPVTPSYLLRAVDLRLGPGGVGAVEPEQAVFMPLFRRTFTIAAVTTGLCLLLAYPTAYTLAGLPPGWARVGLAFVLIPFWTSILVRSVAWFVLLQRDGPVNATLLALGLVQTPLTLVFTRFAVYLAMVHVLLPFTVMPLYSVLKGIDPATRRAAASLGAPPWRAFLRVTLPLSMPGVAASALITFMLAVGFYVTPALVGGPGDQMVSAFIAFYTTGSINWGMAAALATLLLAATFAIVAAARRVLPLAAPVR